MFKKIMSQSAFGGGREAGGVRYGKRSEVSAYEEAEMERMAAKRKEGDKKTVEDFLRLVPIMQRLASVNSEWNWYMAQDHQPVPHEKSLPDYCYNIFEKFKRTYFKALPRLSDTISGDLEGLALCKTVADAKQVISIDWVRLGTVIGFGIRGKRFVEMEAENELKREGVWGLVAENGASDMVLVFDQARLEKMSKDCGIQDVGAGLQQILNDDTSASIEKLSCLIEYFLQYAYLWGSDALADFNIGVAAGLKGFLNEDGKAVGESVRSHIYSFLLMAWPEIKEMVESKPQKTVSYLHKWMLPFMRHGMVTLIDLETLRDVCAPPPSGIGLSLRPFKPIPSA